MYICVCMQANNSELYLLYTVYRTWENFGESLLMNQMARKILANLLAGLQLFHCIYNYW